MQQQQQQKKKKREKRNRWQRPHADDGDRVTLLLWTGNQKDVDLNPAPGDP